MIGDTVRAKPIYLSWLKAGPPILKAETELGDKKR